MPFPKPCHTESEYYVWYDKNTGRYLTNTPGWAPFGHPNKLMYHSSRHLEEADRYTPKPTVPPAYAKYAEDLVLLKVTRTVSYDFEVES